MASIPTVSFLKGFSGLVFSYSFLIGPNASQSAAFSERVSKQLIILLSHIFYPGEFDIYTAHDLQRICESYDDTAVMAVIDDQFNSRETLKSLQNSIRLDKTFPTKMKELARRYFNTVIKAAPFIVLVSTDSSNIPLLLNLAIKNWCKRPDGQFNHASPRKASFMQGDGLRRGYQSEDTPMKNRPVQKDLEDDRKQLAKNSPNIPLMFVERDDTSSKHLITVVLTSRRYLLLNIFDITLERLLFEWLIDGGRFMDAILTYSNSSIYFPHNIRQLPLQLREFFTGKYYNLQVVIRNVPLILADIFGSVLSSFDLRKNILKYTTNNLDSFRDFIRQKQIESIQAYMENSHQALLDEVMPHMLGFFSLNIFNLKGCLGMMLMEDVYGPLKLLKQGKSFPVTLYDIWERESPAEQVETKPQLIDENEFLNNYSSVTYIYEADAALMIAISSTPSNKSKIFGKMVNKSTYKRSSSVSTTFQEASLSTSVLMGTAKFGGHGNVSKEYAGKASVKTNKDIIDSNLSSMFILKNYERFCFMFLAALGATQRVVTIVSHCHTSMQDTMTQFISTLFCGYWAVTLVGNKASDFLSSLTESFRVSLLSSSKKPFSNLWFYYLRSYAMKFQTKTIPEAIYPQMLAIKPFDRVPYVSVPLITTKLDLLSPSISVMSPWSRDIAKIVSSSKDMNLARIISIPIPGVPTFDDVFSSNHITNDVKLRQCFGTSLGSLLLTFNKLTRDTTNTNGPTIHLTVRARQLRLDHNKLTQDISLSKEIVDDAAVFALEGVQTSIMCARNILMRTFSEIVIDEPIYYSSTSLDNFFSYISDLVANLEADIFSYLPGFLSYHTLIKDIEASFTLDILFEAKNTIFFGLSADLFEYLTIYINTLNTINKDIVFSLDILDEHVSVVLRAVSLGAFIDRLKDLSEIVYKRQLAASDLELFNIPNTPLVMDNLLLLINSLFMGMHTQMSLDIYFSNFSFKMCTNDRFDEVVSTFNNYKQSIAHFITVIALTKVHEFSSGLPLILPHSTETQITPLYSVLPSRTTLLNTLSLTFSLKTTLLRNDLLSDFLSSDSFRNNSDLQAYLLTLMATSLQYILSRLEGVHDVAYVPTGSTSDGEHARHATFSYATFDIICTDASLSKIIALFFDEEEDNNIAVLIAATSNDYWLCFAIQTLYQFFNLLTESSVQQISALLPDYYKGFPTKIDIVRGMLTPSSTCVSEAFTQHFTSLPASYAELFNRPKATEYIQSIRSHYENAAAQQSRLRLEELQRLQATNLEIVSKKNALLAKAELLSSSVTHEDALLIELTTKLAQLKAHRQMLEQRLEAKSQGEATFGLSGISSYTHTQIADLSSSLRTKSLKSEPHEQKHSTDKGTPSSIFNHNITEFLTTVFNIQLKKKRVYAINGFPMWFKHTEMNTFTTHPLQIGLNSVHPSHSTITKKHEFYDSLPLYVIHLSKTSSQLYYQETAMWYAMHLQLALSLAQNIPLRHEIQPAGLYSRLINRTIGLGHPIAVPIVHGCNVYFRDLQTTVLAKSIIKGHQSIFSLHTQDGHGPTVDPTGPMLSLSPDVVLPRINFQICAGMIMENSSVIAYHLDTDISIHAGLKAPADPTEYLFYLYRDYLLHKSRIG